jgi:hypothetical protein
LILPSQINNSNHEQKADVNNKKYNILYNKQINNNPMSYLGISKSGTLTRSKTKVSAAYSISLDRLPRRIPSIVLNMGPNGLGVARSLGRLGIPVISMDSDPHAAGFKSKYVKPATCPDSLNEPDRLLDYLKAVSEDLGEKAVLFHRQLVGNGRRVGLQNSM